MEHLGQFISNHWQLSAAFIVVLVLMLINELISQKKKAAALSPQLVVDKINNENAVVIDLRDKKAFDNGHIIDAIQAVEADFAQPKMTKYKTKPLILVCDRGIQASSLAAKLKTQGYSPFVLQGGIEAWKATNLPLVK